MNNIPVTTITNTIEELQKRCEQLEQQNAELSAKLKWFDVGAELKSPEADGIAYPEIDGYNDHNLKKGKGHLCSAWYCANSITRDVHPTSMIIVSDFSLVENPVNGVFC